MSLDSLLLALAGVSVSGFMFLLGWVIRINHRLGEVDVALEKRTTYSWIEGHIQEDMKTFSLKIDEMSSSLGSVRSHLESEFGNVNTEGNTKKVIRELRGEVTEIKDVLKGDMKNAGLLTEFRHLEQVVEKLASR
jgi:hypothetical protein